MINNIDNLFNRFNNLIDSLIIGFKKNNLDEDSIEFLAGKTRQFMTFTQIAFLKILFKILEKGETTFKYKFSDEIEYLNKMIETVFKQMEDLLEELHHNHGNKETQENIDYLIKNLEFIKNIITNLCEMAFSVLKYQADQIDEEEFRKSYRNFKSKVNQDFSDLSNQIKEE